MTEAPPPDDTAPPAQGGGFTFQELWNAADSERFRLDVRATSNGAEGIRRRAAGDTIGADILERDARNSAREAAIFEAIAILLGRVARSRVIKSELAAIVAQERAEAETEKDKGESDAHHA